MTPDEAAQRWCPFVRLQAQGNTLVDNRGGTSATGTPALNYNCIADSCACWRWHPETSEQDGYCGMAGA